MGTRMHTGRKPIPRLQQISKHMVKTTTEQRFSEEMNHMSVRITPQEVRITPQEVGIPPEEVAKAFQHSEHQSLDPITLAQ